MQAKQDVGGEVPGIGALLPRREKDVVDTPDVSSPDTDVADLDIVVEDDDEPMSASAVDEDWRRLVVNPEEYDKLYFNNEEWLTDFRSTMTSYLRLYIFADKYNVHQLRYPARFPCPSADLQLVARPRQRAYSVRLHQFANIVQLH
jgi:hypothetical protein